MTSVIRMFFIVTVMLLTACSVPAKTKKAKKVSAKAELLEAYTRDRLAGTSEGNSETSTYLVIVWLSSTYPESFFWRGSGGWLPCKSEKAHKVLAGSRDMPDGIDYTIERVRPDAIKAGDTLLLTVLRGGKFPIPAEIKDNVQNTLFFRTNGSNWIPLAVKTLKKKQPIAMP